MPQNVSSQQFRKRFCVVCFRVTGNIIHDEKAIGLCLLCLQNKTGNKCLEPLKYFRKYSETYVFSFYISVQIRRIL